MIETILPSGLKVKLRPISLVTLLGAGKVPGSFITMIKAIVAERGMDPDEIKAVLASEGDLADFASFYLEYAKMAVISPKLVEDNPGDGEVSLYDLTDSDFVTIFVTTQKAKAADTKLFLEGGGKTDKAAGDDESM